MEITRPKRAHVTAKKTLKSKDKRLLIAKPFKPFFALPLLILNYFKMYNILEGNNRIRKYSKRNTARIYETYIWTYCIIFITKVQCHFKYKTYCTCNLIYTKIKLLNANFATLFRNGFYIWSRWIMLILSYPLTTILKLE